MAMQALKFISGVRLNRGSRLMVSIGVILAGVGHAHVAGAQETQAGPTSALLEDIVVTARKREELAQNVPLSVSAFDAEQIEALKVRNLESLTVGMPNVALDDIRTFAGTANFSIRGLGINSSIPSIDPTVGIFVDGVYIANNLGVILDTFDLADIQVLRGPQGTLFGRNVTGGAVLVNSRKPGDSLELSVRGAVDGNPDGDGGLNRYLTASIGGPLSDTFRARLSVYDNSDDGWFENEFDGADFGESETTSIRPVLMWTPTEALEMVLRYEYTESDGDGPAAQSHTNGLGVPGSPVNFERDSHRFSVDERGMTDLEVNFLALETNWDVGRGTLTNIFGWRDLDLLARSDIDAQPVPMFHALALTESDQISDELRYTAEFEGFDLTMGLYYLSNEIKYSERRELLGVLLVGTPLEGQPFLTQDGGGDYQVETSAAFAEVDYGLTDALSLIAGLRYTHEKKEVDIASLTRNINSPCDVTAGTCPYDFSDDETWDAVSGRLGLKYETANGSTAYAHVSRGQRSGGYNLRNTAADTVNFGPGPFDEETIDSFEVGFKSDFGGRGRLNAAAFYNRVDDMQREINLADPVAGVVQVIRNTADAEIPGVEVDGVFALGERTVLLASVGWLDAQYTSVRFDLNGDGAIDGLDEDLELPRAAEWTYSVGLTHTAPLGSWGDMTLRVNYAFRDDSFYTDNNLGFLLDQEVLDVGFDFQSAGGHWLLSLYGKNLLDDVKHGGDTQLPALLGPVPLGGAFSPLAKGSVVGIEIAYRL
jgi:iron complex outermembrane recepter protein